VPRGPALRGQISGDAPEPVRFRFTNNCQTLLTIVVKLSGYTSAFLLLCPQPLSGHVSKDPVSPSYDWKVMSSSEDENPPADISRCHAKGEPPSGSHVVPPSRSPTVFSSARHVSPSKHDRELFPARRAYQEKLQY